MKTKLQETLAGKEYESFLKDYGFELVLDEDSTYFACTVVKNSELLLAFTYQMNMGENIALAEVHSPIAASCIAARTNGWSLIGEVWSGAYDEFHKESKSLPYPHKLERTDEIRIISGMLHTLISKIRTKEVSVSSPKYRIETTNANE